MATIKKKQLIPLDANRHSFMTLELREQLKRRVIGQDAAIQHIVEAYQRIESGLTPATRPIANLLFLGPTGTGKTRLVEATAAIFFGTPDAVNKVNCAEFQHSHEISKLIGSPPGYLGHRETEPKFTQERIERYQTAKNPFNFVLFDEVEKAHDALWLLLLGILDKGQLTLGDGREVSFNQSIVILTSNLGAREIEKLSSGRIGFAGPPTGDDGHDSREQEAMKAARSKFSPEFMNRLDQTVVFNALSNDDMRQILDIEITAMNMRLAQSAKECAVIVSDEMKAFLIAEGFDKRYGARALKRTIDKYLTLPIANLIATDQVAQGEIIEVDRIDGITKFSKRAGFITSATAMF